MTLSISTSNRMEKLVSALAGVLSQPLTEPLAPEIIVVQSKGMQRWLAMELAATFGVWANCRYPFPNAMIRRLFSLLMSAIPESSAFDPDVMTWKIVELLSRFCGRPECAQLQHYLVTDHDGLKRFQLAGKIADTFDQYTLFRPSLLADWEAGKNADDDAAWQALLWRELATGGSGKHRGQLKEAFFRQLETGLPATAVIPARISVFGISYLPQYHLDILAAVARITDVHLFLLSPTREYWADIVSRREMARLERTAPQADSLRSEGNPLLASLGNLGRDFSDMVIELSDAAAVQQDYYDDPGRDSLLHALQTDILELAGAGDAASLHRLDPHDRSVRIHSCHSPLREIEVLHDNLLALLEEIDGLTPRDIVVMTPDIELYAPYIAAVFGGCQDAAIKIPYSIADRKLSSEGHIAAVMLKLIGLPGSRCTVVQLFDILQSTPVSRRFKLDEAELEAIRGWLEATRIRWGIDRQDRLELGLPAYGENSWRAGLDRLLLGYAMPEERGRIFNNLLPFDEMEGAAAQTLGKLAEFVSAIEQLTACLNGARTLEGWQEQFRNLLADFIAADDDNAHEMAAVTGVVESIGDIAEQAGFNETVHYAVIHSWVTARLEQEQQGLGFMTGGVTFCAMLPMRSIPFRVVALTGMSDGAFPRQSRPAGFDLLARNPQRGDRSLRDEDRYLFLEALLSARDSLYISYVGQSVKDNSEVPPSVLVAEFMDAINRTCLENGGTPPAERLLTRHRLQPFSKDYFTAQSPLFSYSSENCAALLEQRDASGSAGQFMTFPLKTPPDEMKTVTLPQLLRFFDNPARFFMESRLQTRLEGAGYPLEEREPFSVGGLESYGLYRDILECLLTGDEPRNLLAVARCQGMLPPARHGEILFNGAVRTVEPFAATVQRTINGAVSLPPPVFSLELAEFTLTGRLGRIWPDRKIHYRCAKIKPKDQLRAWLEHLVLNTLELPGYPRETLLLMLDGSLTYRAVDNAAAILQTLLELYWQGLTMPLRFFPTSSFAYAQNLKWELKKARSAWEDGYNDTAGEGRDPYFRRCFGAVDPFNAEFEGIARTLLEPLFAHQQKVKP